MRRISSNPVIGIGSFDVACRSGYVPGYKVGFWRRTLNRFYLRIRRPDLVDTKPVKTDPDAYEPVSALDQMAMLELQKRSHDSWAGDKVTLVPPAAHKLMDLHLARSERSGGETTPVIVFRRLGIHLTAGQADLLLQEARKKSEEAEAAKAIHTNLPDDKCDCGH